MTLQNPEGEEFGQSLSRTVSQINAFLHFIQKFKMVAKISGKKIFGKSRLMTLYIAWGSKISPKLLYLTVFKKKMFLRFTQKFKMAAKNYFYEKLQVHSACALRVKKFVKIALSHTFSEIFKIFHFHC